MNRHRIQTVVMSLMILSIISACTTYISKREKDHPARSSAVQVHRAPQPAVELNSTEVRLPISMDKAFPVPVINMMVAGKGPYRFVVDTGTSGAFVIRKAIVDQLPTKPIGYAMVGDGSGKNMKHVPLVMIDEAQAGGLILKNIMTIAMEPSDDHAASIPDDLDGILGMQLFEDYLLTIDFLERELVVKSLDAEDGIMSGAIPYDYSQKTITIETRIAGELYKLAVDTGHRGTVTLPISGAEKMPLSESLQEIESVATVTNTYSRKRSRVDGTFELAEHQLIDLPLIFTSEHSPSLLGNGVLMNFAITIDQASQMILFESDSNVLRDIDLFTEGISEES